MFNLCFRSFGKYEEELNGYRMEKMREITLLMALEQIVYEHTKKNLSPNTFGDVLK